MGGLCLKKPFSKTFNLWKIKTCFYKINNSVNIICLVGVRFKIQKIVGIVRYKGVFRVTMHNLQINIFLFLQKQTLFIKNICVCYRRRDG